jgi:hypothetical protein
MHAYLACWAWAFVALVLSVFITAIIYRWMGDGLDLNGWVPEAITALIVSAGQAGGYVLQQHFPMPNSYGLRSYGGGSVEGSIFVLSIWLGYKLTHLMSWDFLEYMILIIVNACLTFIAVLVFY